MQSGLGHAIFLQREAYEEQMLGDEHRLHDARESLVLLAVVRHLRAREHNVLGVVDVTCLGLGWVRVGVGVRGGVRVRVRVRVELQGHRGV